MAVVATVLAMVVVLVPARLRVIETLAPDRGGVMPIGKRFPVLVQNKRPKMVAEATGNAILSSATVDGVIAVVKTMRRARPRNKSLCADEKP